MMSKHLLLVAFISLFFSLSIRAQNISNEGSDFWAVFPSHIANGTNGTTLDNHASLSIFVTSKSNTEVTVSCGAAPVQTKAIPANTSVEFMIDWKSAYIDYNSTNGTLGNNSNIKVLNKGIHIKVTNGMPKVSAYAHIYAGNRSAASLILPIETLGKSYFSVNYTQTESPAGNNYLALIATEDNTKLIIKDKNGREFPIPELNTGDIYQYTSGTQDLTGTAVYVDPTTSSICKKFAAFSGSSYIRIGDGNASGYDPLYQQIYPVESLGKTYGIVPFKNQSYLFRAVAVEPNTNIYQDGILVANLAKAGDYYSSERLNNPVLVTADRNVLVSQYMFSSNRASTSGGSVANGDPDMVLLNSIEFNVKNITVFSSTLENILEKYINILIKTNKTSTLKINGIVPSVTWTTLPTNASYSYAQISVNDASLTLTADDGFNAIAYGYGRTESYAYSAGTNLSSNNYLTVVNSTNSTESQDGCVGVLSNFKITLPYQPDEILWNLDVSATISHLQLLEKKPVADGSFLYIYNSPYSETFNTAGSHNIHVNAHAPTTACVLENSEKDYSFNIYSLPVAAFTLPASACAKTDISFTTADIDLNAVKISNWRWDFGDGTAISEEQNPKHQYASGGDYPITLSVKSTEGCWSDPVTAKVIHINPLPVTKFSSNNLRTCVNTAIVFTDESSINTSLIPVSIIKKWHWDFGDGSSIDKDDNSTVTHQYSLKGNFPVVLTTTTDNNCSTSSAVVSIAVTDLPTADFTLPTVCFDDGIAKFINTSKNIDGSINNLKYEWDFGETSSLSNIATTTNGAHTFLAAGDYFITLKVKNENDCIVSTTKSFTINGQVKTVDFTVQNSDDLCSNMAVIINNLSTAVSGKITKIQIFKDFLNAPNDELTIEDPTDEDIILNYEPFGGLTNKDITIKLIAYSGTVCSKEISKVISLKPSPILKFDEIPLVCENDGNILINQASEVSGAIGSGIYTSDGDGMQEDGTFNPKIAGPGEHKITYTFTSNSCSSFITKTVQVYKSPTLNIGSTIYILAGGEMVLPAMATGNNLSYEWSPSVGLNNNMILNPTASPEKDTEYTLTVTNQPDGCMTSSKILVKVLEALSPPNAFTPNGDNVNDVWVVKHLESYPNATVEIFNRNGNRVFSSLGYKIPFDGTFQNEPLPVGVYYYIINPRNGRKAINGPLTIIR